VKGMVKVIGVAGLAGALALSACGGGAPVHHAAHAQAAPVPTGTASPWYQAGYGFGQRAIQAGYGEGFTNLELLCTTASLPGRPRPFQANNGASISFNLPPGFDSGKNNPYGNTATDWNQGSWIQGCDAAGNTSALPAAVPSSAASNSPNTQPPSPPAPAPAQTLTPCGKLQSWYYATGDSEITAVQNDYDQIQSDAGLDTALPADDGTRLATDATRALSDPPPMDASQYSAGMQAFAQAGKQIAMGTVTTGANGELTTGINDIAAVINAQQNCSAE
jgi:hypothetical protein